MESSPRTWGCFHRGDHRSHQLGVFPTHVGVFPAGRAADARSDRLPHARGGVSTEEGLRLIDNESSPRTWGCFQVPRVAIVRPAVFPTHVGVFPQEPEAHPGRSCLPHARGGVSYASHATALRWLSSPRTWGCFPKIMPRVPVSFVFPTHVGVFLTTLFLGLDWLCLPHARGGVS